MSDYIGDNEVKSVKVPNAHLKSVQNYKKKITQQIRQIFVTGHL